MSDDTLRRARKGRGAREGQDTQTRTRGVASTAVQDPESPDIPDMPQEFLDSTPPDHAYLGDPNLGDPRLMGDDGSARAAGLEVYPDQAFDSAATPREPADIADHENNRGIAEEPDKDRVSGEPAARSMPEPDAPDAPEAPDAPDPAARPAEPDETGSEEGEGDAVAEIGGLELDPGDGVSRDGVNARPHMPDPELSEAS